ncbi:nucleoside-diphosphate-sugar epimerase [Pseudoduganella lurida]|uniref:Nucleoside-diphosphate-sugar epimerase n=1 Tax=Pseudoduganella lurida TaxID=1036180 RepID=A0A562R5Y5_9BURK|nr:SDR family oxidoreductase [Pseudoduganella lurida]TWI64502.1 nucleoside-diphosphate-sugar epimerase [Pseudoduganella lurida]
MRVFVTGATGFVGSAIVKELLGAGHEVRGLVRSEEAATALSRTGAETYRGRLEDLDGLRRGVEGVDAVIHTAFNHDFSRFADSCAEDARVIAGLGVALEGRPLIVTSGLARLAQGRPATEDDAPAPGFPRQSEAAAAAVRAESGKAWVMRLPPSVHGTGDHGFVPMLIDVARRTGVSAFVGDGGNLWSSTHRFDVARAYRLAVESGGSGPWHAVAEEGIAFRDIAAAIGRGLGLPVKALAKEEAAAHFGWLAHFVADDMGASSARTQAALGWVPEQVGLLRDIDEGGYFG